MLHTGQQPHSCRVCGARFSVASNCRRHERGHERPRLQCSVCQRMFVSTTTFDRHMAKHERENNSRTCEACGRTFSRQRDLRRHIACSHGELRFTCEACGRAFGYAFNRNRHQRSCALYAALHNQENSGSRHDDD